VPRSSIQRDSDTLRPLESQITTLTSLIDRGKAQGRFPRPLEQEYQRYRLSQFFSQDIRIIMSGLLVFVVFGWADFSFGGHQSTLLFSVRVLLAVTLVATVIWLPRSPLRRYAMRALVGGIYICFASVLWNISMVELPLAYFYHLGVIPMQVFALLGLRSDYRAMLGCSLAMLFSYAAFIIFMPGPEVPSEIDALANSMAPFYLLFWAILIMMASYLSYIIESGTRTDYIKNRLLALEAERLQYLGRRLQQLSTTDGLTGIANRRHAEEQLLDEWRRCARSELPLAVMMVDVDYFKKFNDAYGHQQGDQCLRRIAETMDGFCRRPGDLCARYGGEEFVMLLPEMTIERAEAMAQEVCAAIEHLAIEHNQSPHGVATVSIGVAAVVPAGQANYEELLREADMGLYEAKERGRNQVFRRLPGNPSAA